MGIYNINCRREQKRLVLVGIFVFAGLYWALVGRLNQDYTFLELTEDSLERTCNCTKILQQDAEEMEHAKLLSITRSFLNKTRVPEEKYTEWTRDCEKFRVMHKYLTFPLSHEEEEFPIAYSLVIHHKVQNFERLLRAIYAPQNLYCVHVDNKSTESFKSAVQAIASCFDNVFISSQLENVVYASWSRVQADINCMKDLHTMSSRWKYFINLCGQDFPIKTNLEIVRKLKALNGKNSLETEKMPQGKEWRWKKHHEIVKGAIISSDENKKPPPIDNPIFSGGAYIVVCRDFVRYVLEEPLVQELIEWSKDTYSPDEFLWATLQRLPGVPGSIPSNVRYDVTDINSIARLVKWEYFEGQMSKGAMYPPCSGTHVRAVCVYGVGDLSWMLQQHHLFANKFDSDMDYFAVYCLEKHLRHKALSTLS